VSLIELAADLYVIEVMRHYLDRTTEISNSSCNADDDTPSADKAISTLIQR